MSNELVKSSTVESLKNVVENMWGFWKEDVAKYSELSVTFGIDSNGEEWAFQTGDNSFTGTAYLFPNWAVITLYPESDKESVIEWVLDEWEDLLVEGREVFENED